MCLCALLCALVVLLLCGLCVESLFGLSFHWISLELGFSCMAVASKGDGRSTSTTPLLLPTIEKDAQGAFIAITCGNISGQFYCAKFSQTKTGQN